MVEHLPKLLASEERATTSMKLRANFRGGHRLYTQHIDRCSTQERKKGVELLCFVFAGCFKSYTKVR